MKRTKEQMAARAAEASKGIVVVKVPGKTQAEILGASTAEEKKILSQLLKDIKA